MRLAYVHLPRFPVQRRVLEAPALAGQPFVLVEEVRGQRRVAFASTAALKAGVRPGSTLTAASALVAGLSHFPHAFAAEAAALLSLGEALLVLAPAFQLDAPEGLWLDASAAGLCGGEETWAARVVEACAAQGWRARVVVADEAFTARALARFGVRRAEVVPSGEGGRALAPLPLSALEGAETGRLEALRALGLATLGEVAALPATAVVARGGAEALRAHRMARGEEPSRFVPTPLPEVLEEVLSLDWPAESLEPVLFGLKTLVDRLCARLSGRRRAAVRLTLAFRLEPSGEAQVALSLARPTAQAKLLLDLARHRLEGLTLERPVVGLRARMDEDCADPGQQLVLGDGPAGDAALEVVLSRLATTLGEEALFAAGVEGVHRPEAAVRPRAFRPPARPEGLLAELGGETAEKTREVEAALAERPARLLPQPAPLEVALGVGGELAGARVEGRWRRASGLAGPERLGGEWWRGGGFSRDYYRVHLEGLGLAWVYRDGRDGRFYLQGLFD
ncbi:MAG: DNA polymerase Y family protein [Myxococcaceae bacterium]|nr:DNA polymerase Y family protein [Myxococcaceae bacterium]MCI0671564.1 DNA polymerase Y family protein [Myxococcaceae bacterium]